MLRRLGRGESGSVGIGWREDEEDDDGWVEQEEVKEEEEEVQC